MKLCSCLCAVKIWTLIGKEGHLLGRGCSWDPRGTGYSTSHLQKQVEERRENRHERTLGQTSPLRITLPTQLVSTSVAFNLLSTDSFCLLWSWLKMKQEAVIRNLVDQRSVSSEICRLKITGRTIRTMIFFFSNLLSN